MSDQREAVVITGLEEVFTSGEFGRTSVRRPLLGSVPKESSGAAQLEQVAVLSMPRRESNRHRALAAVSGIAAAAMVVAGLAAGTAQSGRADRSARGAPVGVSAVAGSGTPPGESGGGNVTGPARLTGASNGTGGPPSMTLTGEWNQPASSASTPAPTRQVAPARTAASIAAAPSTPSVYAGPSGAASVPGSPPSSSPPAGAPTNPLSPALSVVSNAPATVGVTTTADQLGSNQALPAPANSAVRDVAATTG